MIELSTLISALIALVLLPMSVEIRTIRKEQANIDRRLSRLEGSLGISITENSDD